KDIIKNKNEIVAKVLDFIYERLRSLYSEQNKNINVFRAVLASTPTNLLDFTKRFDAVDAFIQLPEASDLVEIYKRIRNILDKAPSLDNIKFNISLAQEPAEQNLSALVKKEIKIITQLYQHQEYSELLQELIKLKPPLSVFFEKVMVMVEDEKLRNNRLALLKSIQNLFSLIADLSYLVSGNKNKGSSLYNIH
ncbi:MAG: glycine--tRNA ligase subunit beta, partial [Gammaproteobacteria bacterium]|nr:glycine--tRNA ligase subunit beta [Gammaproteobacteria bacterium]